MMRSLPNILTLSRIASIPVLAVLIPLHGAFWDWTALALFIAAGLTDALDGYLARRQAAVSALGRFLDPIADKLMVASVLFMLVVSGDIAGLTVLAALVIVCREVLISGLREFLAELRVKLAVTALAKWKTGIQMTAIGFLIVGHSAAPVPATLIGDLGLWVAAAITLVTGYDYLRAGLRHMSGAGEGS